MSGSSLASQALVASASTPRAGVIVSEFPLNKHEIGGRPVHEGRLRNFPIVFECILFVSAHVRATTAEALNVKGGIQR